MRGRERMCTAASLEADTERAKRTKVARLLPGHLRTSCWAGLLGLAEDAVHLGAADRAGALCHAPARVTDPNLTVERALLLALHAVTLVGLGHRRSSLGRCAGRWPA